MNKPTPIVYGIRNCDTVRRARAWLDSHGIDYRFHDYKSQGVPADHLARWTATKGWEVLVNRQGTTWRKLDDTVKASVVDGDSAVSVMTANASVIRRPVVEWEASKITVGFSEASFAEAAGASQGRSA